MPRIYKENGKDKSFDASEMEVERMLQNGLIVPCEGRRGWRMLSARERRETSISRNGGGKLAALGMSQQMVYRDGMRYSFKHINVADRPLFNGYRAFLPVVKPPAPPTLKKEVIEGNRRLSAWFGERRMLWTLMHDCGHYLIEFKCSSANAAG